MVTYAFCIRHNRVVSFRLRIHRRRARRRRRRRGETVALVLLSLHRIRRAARPHEKVWPIAARRAISPRAIGSTAAWGRARRRHVALSLRARQSSARARRALARPPSRESAGGAGAGYGAEGARFVLKGALTWSATSRSVLSFLSLSHSRRLLSTVFVTLLRVRSSLSRAMYAILHDRDSFHLFRSDV